jgi:hypothetical protein
MPTPKVNSWLGWRIFTVNSLLDLHSLLRWRSPIFLQWIAWWHSWVPKAIFNNMLITTDIKYPILHLLLWILLLVDKALYLKRTCLSLATLMVWCVSVSYSLASTILSQVLNFISWKFSLRLPSSIWWCPSGVWWSVMLNNTSSPSF